MLRDNLRKAGGRHPKNPAARNSFAELTFVWTDRFSHYFEDPVLITFYRFSWLATVASDSAGGMFCPPDANSPPELLEISQLKVLEDNFPVSNDGAGVSEACVFDSSPGPTTPVTRAIDRSCDWQRREPDQGWA